MHSLTIVVGPTAWVLLYKDEQKAMDARNTLDTYARGEVHGAGHVRIEDDFGQAATLIPGSVHGYMLEDMERSKLARVEMAMHQQRTQLLAQKTAQNDPGLRAMSMMNGPAILQPMGPGGPPR